jgi:serine protease Do
MYRTALVSILTTFICVLPTSAAERDGDDKAGKTLKDLENAFVSAISKAKPTVVCILVSRSDDYRLLGAVPTQNYAGQLGEFDAGPFLTLSKGDKSKEERIRRLNMADEDHIPEAYGSGVILDTKGLILTNYHVVRDATKIFVRVPGGKGSYADVLAADPRSDLAVLKLLKPPAGLKAVKMGRGEDLEAGNLVVAVSNPYAAGFADGNPSADWGVISNLRRRVSDKQMREDERVKPLVYYGTLIQTSTRINFGCSGGALLNLDGELIGLITSVAAITGTDTPGGFAVPMNGTFRKIVDRLKEGKEVEYGFLGVTFKNPNDSDPFGVPIGTVAGDSPAQKAGLRDGQYIVKIDGMKITNKDDLFLAIGAALAGSTIRLEVADTHGGVPRTLTPTLAKFHYPGKVIAREIPPAVGGLRVDWTSTLSRGGPPAPIPKGVVIREIIPGSPAEKAKLRVDTVITRVNGRTVLTPAEYYSEVIGASGPIELTLSNDDKVKINPK